MSKMIKIPEEEYNVLRETFNKGLELLSRFGLAGNEVLTNRVSSKKPKQTKQQGIEKYKNLISSGSKITKPNHLKKR